MPRLKNELPIDEYHITRSTIAATPQSVLLFYNPGLKISEMVAYDHPFRIAGDARGVQPAYCPIHVEERGFFEVPTAVMVGSPENGIEEQETQIPGMFQKIMSQYRQRGVVLVEFPKHKSRGHDDHVVETMEEAVRVGDAFFDQFMRETANEWIRIVERTRSEGQVPMGATGLFKQALAYLAITDPANSVQMIDAERKSAGNQRDNNDKVSELTGQLAELRGMIAGLMAGKKETA